jgi:hypothetical protein
MDVTLSMYISIERVNMNRRRTFISTLENGSQKFFSSEKNPDITPRGHQ